MSTANRHVIIGTAGHVDHGKTTLIKALTGIDTDRLKEEQERGMTIDLGFASLSLPGDRKVGIVDVPGHERFLKNMLAGATGVDIVLLVIAADEGVMPQTREHLEILELLEAKQGVVALTKTDMVDEEWLQVVEEDIRSALKPTFLQDAPIVMVSGVTGAGVNDLKDVLASLADTVEQRSSEGPFRLPVDRVFTMTGFGVVVTGTLVSGTMRVGDHINLLPRGLPSRIRGIQVHGSKQQDAVAGTRVAVNLVGLEVSDIARGDVVVPPGYLAASFRIDAFIRLLPDAPKPLRNRTRIRFHIGTAEHIGRVTVLGSDEIAAGSERYAQFVSETPIVAARGDRFVIRSYSPMRTIGGGTVLDPNAERHRASDARVIETLETRRKGEPLDLLEDALLLAPGPVAAKDAGTKVGVSEQEARLLAACLVDSGKAIVLDGDRLIHSAVYSRLASRIMSILEQFHSDNPLKAGMPKEELRAAAAREVDSKSFAAILAQMEQVAVSENVVRLSVHEARLSPEQERAAATLDHLYRESAFNPPQESPADAAVFQYLVDKGELVKIDEGLYLHKDTIARAEQLLRERLADGSKITVSGFRDLTGSTRKYVVPLLEYFDSKRVTRRVGDERVLIR